jgi:hypothetical protein
MKYLVIILLTVFSFGARSQSIYTPMTARGYQMKYVKVDSGFALPFRDTTIGRGVDRPGLMVVNPQDSLPYYYSGSRWKPVYVDSSGVIEMINGKIDSITVNGNNIFYWVAGLGYGQQLNKLDSIHVSSDSIFTCIAGNCTFQYLTTAGTGTVTQIIAGFGLLPDTITASGTLAVDTSVFHTSNWNNAAYAAISHTHSASDIISGTLPIVRGGTGLSGIGAVGQELRVASSGTALEYFTPNYASQTYVDSLNSVKSLSGSYYGIISGGIVTYSGTGYTYYVSACKYMIGGVVYNSRDTSITLTAADATDPRIDLFAVDTLNRVVKITGTAAATPLTPQVDPASQIALTTGITLPPTSTTPTGTSSTLIYDENTEWTTGGTATVDFNNTAQPYHGTKDAYVSAYSKNSNLTFTNGSTVTVSGQILRLFIRLNNSNYSFQVQFFNGSTAVSSIVTAPVNNSLFGSYQNISIPLSSFSWSSTVFNKLVVTMTGKGTAGTYYLDYVSIESGTPIVTPPTDYSNKLDSVYLRNDSLFQYVKGVETFKGKTTGGGGTTANSVTFNNSGTGDASGTTFNGSVARTISSNTIGAVAKADSTTAYVTPTQLAAINNHINLYYPLYGINADSSVHFKNDSLPLLTYAPGVDTSGTNAMDIPAKKWVLDRISAITGITRTELQDTATAIRAAIPAQFNPIAGTNVTLSGSYPNITFNASGSGSTVIDSTNQTGILKGDGAHITAAVSGTDIKTINGNSILGGGNLTVSSSSNTVTEKQIYYRKERVIYKAINTSTGAFSTDSTSDISGYLPITGNKSVTINFYGGVNTIYGWTYDSSLTAISEIRSNSLIGTKLSTYTFTTPSNARYYCVYVRYGSTDFHDNINVKSTADTTYSTPITPEQFSGANDRIKIQKALNMARFTSTGVTLNGVYRLDSALMLSSGNTLILKDARLKLDSGAKDNIIRNEAVWNNVFQRGNKDIKIEGVGSAILEGTGDGWGSDNPTGVGTKRWKSIGILFANVEGFELAGLTMKNTNSWAMNMEQSRIGLIHDITIQQTGQVTNQDGINIRRGSDRITINNIKGRAYDDLIALTNIKYAPTLNTLDSNTIYEPYKTNLDIHDIFINNIQRDSVTTSGSGQWNGILLLAKDSLKIHDVNISNVSASSQVNIGFAGYYNNTDAQLGDLSNLNLTNVASAIKVNNLVQNSTFKNINPSVTGISFSLPAGCREITVKYTGKNEEFYDSTISTIYYTDIAGTRAFEGLQIKNNLSGGISDVILATKGGITTTLRQYGSTSVAPFTNNTGLLSNGAMLFIANSNVSTGGTTGNFSWFTSGFNTTERKMFMDNSGNLSLGSNYTGSNKLNVYSPTDAGGLTIDGNTSPALTLNGAGVANGYVGTATASAKFLTNSVSGDMVIKATTRLLLGYGYNPASVSVSSSGVGINTLTPNSPLQTTGFATAYAAKTTAYTLTSADNTIEITANSSAYTLPTAVGIAGREYWITNTGSGSPTIATTSSQTFVNVSGTPTTLTVAQFTSYKLISNGANWLAFKMVN